MSDRLIVISDGTPQCLYVGKVELDPGTGKPVCSHDGFLSLTECRYLRTMMIPTPQGISLSNSVMSIGVSNGSVALAIKPVMYYWPDQNAADLATLERQIAICDEQEKQHRAEKAGITLASSVPNMGRLKE